MIILLLLVFGVCLGSFVNALAWRLHEQATEQRKKRPNEQYLSRLSISRGRSMCSHCHHKLAARDLIPVLSWLSLRGKCRYCGKAIPDNPLVELGLGGLFVASYIWWPVAFTGPQVAVFVLWLMLLTGLVALAMYDARWLLLPDRLVYPLAVVALAQAAVLVMSAASPFHAALNTLLAVAVGGGIFYVLFQVSNGSWIGGGDVKLGWLLGLIVATPARSLVFIFIAALSGSVLAVPLLLGGRLKRNSVLPFGPFLIGAAVLVQLFGADILSWYQHMFLPFD